MTNEIIVQDKLFKPGILSTFYVLPTLHLIFDHHKFTGI